MDKPSRIKVTSNRPPSTVASSSRPVSPSKPRLIPPSTLSPTPVLRPKAKVNTTALSRKLSASSASPSSNVSHANITGLASRSTSPFKSSTIIDNSSSSSLPGKVRARVTAPPASRASPPTSPPLAATHLTSSDTVLSTHKRSSQPSISSTSSAPTSPLQTVTPFQNGDAPIRVTSKLSGVAKAKTTANTNLSPQLAPSPIPFVRQLAPRTRTASVSSFSSHQRPPGTSSPSPSFYPITTATPAANVHRFATTRVSPSANAHHHYQPFAPANDNYINDDPTARYTPPDALQPPQSPPTSAVSFSSRSSTSRSSVSATRSVSFEGSGTSSDVNHGRRASVTVRSSVSVGSDVGLEANLSRSRAASFATNDIEVEYLDAVEAGAGEQDGKAKPTMDAVMDEEHKVKAEAKSNRKIADLEITNRSLLAINSALEATKARQAKEIRELRRKLRETRLILPPHAYRAFKTTMAAEEERAAVEDEDGSSEEDEEDDEKDGREDEAQAGKVIKEDETYRRIRGLVENLLSSGRLALETRPTDLIGGGRTGTKVLSEEEARTWRDGGTGLDDPSLLIEGSDKAGDDGEVPGAVSDDENGEMLLLRSLTQTPEMKLENEDGLQSEDEVEALTQRQESPPPITFTSPP